MGKRGDVLFEEDYKECKIDENGYDAGPID